MNTLGHPGILWDTLGHPRSPKGVPKGSHRMQLESGASGPYIKVVQDHPRSTRTPLGTPGTPGTTQGPRGTPESHKKKKSNFNFLLYTLCAKEKFQKNFPIVTYSELGLSLRSVCEKGLNMSSLSTELPMSQRAFKLNITMSVDLCMEYMYVCVVYL